MISFAFRSFLFFLGATVLRSSEAANSTSDLPCCSYLRIIDAPIQLTSTLRSASKPEGNLDAVVASAIEAAAGPSSPRRQLDAPTQDKTCLQNRANALTPWLYSSAYRVWELRSISFESEFTRFPVDMSLFYASYLPTGLLVMHTTTTPNFPSDWYTAPANAETVECGEYIPWSAADYRSSNMPTLVLVRSEYLTQWQDWATQYPQSATTAVAVDNADILADVTAAVSNSAISKFFPQETCTPCTEVRASTTTPTTTTKSASAAVVAGPGAGNGTVSDGSAGQSSGAASFYSQAAIVRLALSALALFFMV